MADGRDQAVGAVRAVAEAQARGRNREPAGGIRVAQVAGQRHRQAAAHAKSMDQRDHRLGRRLDGVVRGTPSRLRTPQPGLRWSGCFSNSGNVRAGRERRAALARGSRCSGLSGSASNSAIAASNGAPHSGADRIAALRVVQHQPARPARRARRAVCPFAHAFTPDQMTFCLRAARRSLRRRSPARAECRHCARPPAPTVRFMCAACGTA